MADLDFSGKRVLLRAGFDVPTEDGAVVDTSRIEALVPTMRAILDAGASLIVMAHQGRPHGKRVLEESQRPLVPVLAALLGCEIQFADACTGPATEAAAQALQPGDVLLLENLRYDAREEANDPSFAAELARVGDVYVCDAFSNAHRAHASMVGVPALLPSAMGLQMQREVEHLSKLCDAREGVCVIVSGIKLETKVPVIESFLPRSDALVVGGGIANTFLAAAGVEIGTSRTDVDAISTARRLLQEAKRTLLLPADVVVAADPRKRASVRVCMVDEIAPEESIFDLGPQSTAAIVHAVQRAKVIVWNGPLGYFEEDAFSASTIAVAHAVAAATAAGTYSVVGGGDTLRAHAQYALSLQAYSFVSTGGGAMLDFLAGKTLPALTALQL